MLWFRTLNTAHYSYLYDRGNSHK